MLGVKYVQVDIGEYCVVRGWEEWAGTYVDRGPMGFGVQRSTFNKHQDNTKKKN